MNRSAALVSKDLEYSGDSGSGIGNMGATLIARGLAGNRGLTKLVLSSNGITDDGVCALADALKVSTCPLEVLDLADNPCGPKAVAAVVSLVQTISTLLDVVLTGWEIPPDHARLLGMRCLFARCIVRRSSVALTC